MSPRALRWRVVVGVIVLVVVVGALGLLLREEVETGAGHLVHRFGLGGLALGVLACDTLPLTHEPVLLLGWTGGLGFLAIWAVASLASIAAGALGYLLGRRLGRLAPIERLFRRYRIAPFMRRYGVWAVAVAALTPIPYPLASWSAGASRMPFSWMLLGSLARIPKVLVYLSLIALGWSAGG